MRHSPPKIKQLQENIGKLTQIVDLLGKYSQAGNLPASKMKMYINYKVKFKKVKRKVKGRSGRIRKAK